jgi:hypothetical protein
MIMKVLTKLAIATAVPALVFAVPASAQDSEQFVLSLAGSVTSQCELLPEGSGNYNVNMLEFGDQGLGVIAYSCNSPYTVSLESANGGMYNSAASLTIPYAVEAVSTNNGAITVESGDMHGTPVDIVTETNWANIFVNGGIAGGDLDLNFAGILDQYAVAGDYEDTLTIVLAAQL